MSEDRFSVGGIYFYPFSKKGGDRGIHFLVFKKISKTYYEGIVLSNSGDPNNRFYPQAGGKVGLMDGSHIWDRAYSC